ncbi:MAG: dihydrodipicolinate synthase family protein [Pirellulaceae bacterium]
MVRPSSVNALASFPSNDQSFFSRHCPPHGHPLSDRDTLDVEGLQRLVEHLIVGGVHGIFILGTTGEAPSLSYRLRRELINRVCQQVGARVPVLVGITDTSFVESVHLANHAAESGAARAIVLSTPYYFPAGQTELARYVGNLTPQLPLPLMLYNMPSLTKVWFELETLKELAELEQIVGIKDSSGDMEYFGKLMSLRDIRPDWSIMLGPEALIPEAMALGGDGAVTGGANVFPTLFVQCYLASVEGDSQRVRELRQTINDFQGIYEIGKYASRYIKATKCRYVVARSCDDFLAEPFDRFHAPERGSGCKLFWKRSNSRVPQMKLA